MKAPPGNKKRLGCQTEAHLTSYFRRHGTAAVDAVNRGDGSNWSQLCGNDSVLPDAARNELLRGGSRVVRGQRRRFHNLWKSAWLIVIAIIVMIVVVMVIASTTSPGAPPAWMQVSPVHTTMHTITTSPDGVGAPPPPVPRATLVYREWIPGSEGGWILTDAQCVPVRGSFVASPAPRAELATPRAELVKYPEAGE